MSTAMKVIGVCNGGGLGIDPRQLELAPEVDLDEFPMTEDAFLFQQAQGRKYHFTKDMARKVAEDLGRQIRLYEMRWLVRKDGPEVFCEETGCKFQPVCHINPTRLILSEIRRQGDVVKALYILGKNVDGLYGVFYDGKAYSGPAYRFRRGGEVSFDWRSPLIKKARKEARIQSRETGQTFDIWWGYVHTFNQYFEDLRREVIG